MVKGIKLKDLKNKIPLAGMSIDFEITEDNLRQNVFNDICWIKNKKLDSVVFFNLSYDKKIAYKLVYNNN